MKREPDYILLSVVVVLILLGVMILASVSAPISQEKFGFPTFFLLRHIFFGLLPGILLGFLAFKISLAFLKKWSPIFLLISLFLTALVFLPKIGLTFGGAARWLNLGFISLQPSEFLKLSFIIYLAAWLSSRTGKPKNLKSFSAFSTTLIAFSIVLGLVSLLLIFQPDISTLGIIFLSAVLMYFWAETPLKQGFLIGLGGITALASLIILASYRFSRILTFLNPQIDPMGTSYQIKQALIAIGSGGIWGSGLGVATQKFGFLPQPITDSIFAVFCQEMGFIGGATLVFLFLILAWRGFWGAKQMNDKFHQLTFLGITSWIVFQAFVNIGSTIGILPLTGIPLPFISYGGSALTAELIGIGILLNISKLR